MPSTSTLYLEQESVMPVFMGTAVIVVVLSLAIVLLVRSVPSKLILLGVLIAVAGVVFTAVVPSVARLSLVLVILAVVLVLSGLLGVLLTYLVQLFATAKSHTENPPGPRP